MSAMKTNKQIDKQMLLSVSFKEITISTPMFVKQVAR